MINLKLLVITSGSKTIKEIRTIEQNFLRKATSGRNFNNFLKKHTRTENYFPWKKTNGKKYMEKVN
jgi:hypothetical protein